MSPAVVVSRSVHEAVSRRLAGVDQRYTHLRKVLVETLAAAGRPADHSGDRCVSPRAPPEQRLPEHDGPHRRRRRTPGGGHPTTTDGSSSPRSFPVTTTISSVRRAGRWRTSTPHRNWNALLARRRGRWPKNRATRSPSTNSTCSGSVRCAGSRRDPSAVLGSATVRRHRSHDPGPGRAPRQQCFVVTRFCGPGDGEAVITPARTIVEEP